MPLSDRQVRALKPGPKPRKVADGGGLHLLVQPAGGKLWRMKYRIDGKEKLLSFGPYPETTLAQARDRRDEARRQLANGIDPAAVRNAERHADAVTFEAVAREWLAREAEHWAPGHTTRVVGRMEKDVFPYLGARPVAEITAPEILECVRRVADRGAIETAHRELWSIGAVFRFAIATGRATADPVPALRGALPTAKAQHFAAIVEPRAVGELLRAIAGYSGTPAVQAALKLAPLVFVRPGELRRAEWSEIDFESATWTISAAKMKSDRDHLVPLSKQALEILREIEPLTGRGRYVFPSPRSGDRPMSDNGLTAALRRMGYGGDVMTTHGFRAMARTLLDEQLHVPPHLIEHQLAHAVRDPLGRAYNRTAHIKERRQMMQQWADYLDTLRDGAQVIPIRPAERER